MPFKFKLSKRLALMKALLAASAGLALACDRADLTSPQSLSRPLADVIVTSPSPISVVASTDDGSNVPSNTLDNSLATRWSARGDGQWIRYELGTIVTMDHVDIAWYVGDTRSTYFDIEVSSDTVIWTMVFSGQSSGQTLQFERYDFPATAGRYLRIVGHGNSLLTGWISITEVTISQAAASVATASLPVSSVVASASDSTVPQNTRDDNLATRWSAQGDGQWIRYDLGGLAAVEHVDIAWSLGDTRSAYFDIQVSLDTVTWTTVFSGRSSGQTLQLEHYAFPRASAHFIRIVGHGNSMSTWNSITETAIFGTPIAATVAVALLTVSPTTVSVPAGTATQLVAATLDSAGNPLTRRTVIWTTSNAAVAAVSASGLVSGVASGTATITGTSEGKSDTATVIVKAPSCFASLGIWQNNAVVSQSGSFEVQFD